MPQLESFPEVLNIPPKLREPFLRGFTIEDPEPIGQALVALGVPESDVEHWRISTGVNDDNINDENPRSVILSSGFVSLQMTTDAKLHAPKNENQFYEEFKPVAAKYILDSLALGVVATRRVESNNILRRNEGRVERAAWLGGALAADIGLRVTEGISFPVLLPISIGTAAATISLVSFINTPRRPAKRLVKRLGNRAAILKHEIEEVLLPIYSKDI